MVPELLAALDKEQAEFVRPALVRALAALGADPRVQQALVREAGRGEDFFRSAVIEALGDYKAQYAFDALDGDREARRPAAGRCGARAGEDRRQAGARDAGGASADGAASRASRRSRPPSVCWASTATRTRRYLVETLKFAGSQPGFQELLRGARPVPGAPWRSPGTPRRLEALFDDRHSARDDPTRAPVALGVATVALRNTPLLMAMLETARQPRRMPSSCWPKASTCSRRISTRNGSSRSRAGPTGLRRRVADPRR